MNVKELWMKTDTEYSNAPALEWAEKFAALVADEVNAKWAKGEAKIRIPTETMEQEFNNYHRLGYKAGVKAEREACAKLAAWILKMPQNDVSEAIRARKD